MTASTKKPLSSQPLDDMTPDEREAYARQKRAEEKAEQAKLPYTWRQSLEELDLTFPVPAGTRARDVVVDIMNKRLKVALKTAASAVNGGDPTLVDGELFASIIVDDSTWSIEDRCRLLVHLEKQNRMQWWPHVVTHHPQIDVSLIEPENSKLADLDGETRAMVEKMMFDQQQKAMGKPTSDEARKLQMLEQFKQQHPEMDFSQAKIDM
ncbi:hypothetical protein H4R35_002212 [Dimargaris xerosporica]|nr:hypothetical protein H4R35_002212 [Dimargaris xerosporica]